MEKEVILRLSRWAEGVPQPPYYMYLSLTRKCNLNCLMCGRANIKDDVLNPINELPEEVFLDVINQAAEIGVRRIDIGCLGEPMCAPKKTLSVMEAIKRNKIYGWMVTNGSLFDESQIKKIVDMGWDHLVFSIHGPDEEIHDTIVGKKGSFSKTIKTIQTFVNYKKCQSTENPRISIALVLNKKNYNKIDKMIMLSNRLGIDNFIIEPLVIYHETGKSIELNEKERKEFIDCLKICDGLSKKYKINSNFDQIKDEIIKNSSDIPKMIKSKNNGCFFSIPCFSPWLKICITAVGKVNPCPTLWEIGGDDIREKKIAEIWHGKLFGYYREKLKAHNLPETCKKCCATMAIEMGILPKKLLKY